MKISYHEMLLVLGVLLAYKMYKIIQMFICCRKCSATRSTINCGNVPFINVFEKRRLCDIVILHWLLSNKRAHQQYGVVFIHSNCPSIILIYVKIDI